MRYRSVFRCLVVSALIVPFIGIGITELRWDSYPEHWRATLLADGDGGVFGRADEEIADDSFSTELAVLGIVAITILVALIASTIGLLRFRRWGRTLYVVVTVVGILSCTVAGLNVLSPLGYVFDCLGWMLAGAVISMSYLPPISDEFTTRSTKPVEPTGASSFPSDLMTSRVSGDSPGGSLRR